MKSTMFGFWFVTLCWINFDDGISVNYNTEVVCNKFSRGNVQYYIHLEEDL